MYTIRFQPCDDYYWTSGDWKDEVCDNFDQKVVIIGDRHYATIEEADWWREADNITSELDNANDFEDFVFALEDEFPTDILQTIWDMYMENGMLNDDFRFSVAKILHPELNLEYTTIRGYVQGDWAYAYYVSGVDTDILADWFFGNVTDVCLYDEADEYQECVAIPDSELYSMKFAKGGNYKAELADLFGLSPDEVIIEEQ